MLSTTLQVTQGQRPTLVGFHCAQFIPGNVNKYITKANKYTLAIDASLLFAEFKNTFSV